MGWCPISARICLQDASYNYFGQPLAGGDHHFTPSVAKSGTDTNLVTLAAAAPDLTSGATLLGQRVNIVNGTSVSLAGNAIETITSATTKTFTPAQTVYYSPHADKVFATRRPGGSPSPGSPARPTRPPPMRPPP